MNNGLCPPLESKAANLIETSRRAEKAAVKQTFAGIQRQYRIDVHIPIFEAGKASSI